MVLTREDKTGRVGQYCQGSTLRPRKLMRRHPKIPPSRHIKSHYISPKRRVRGVKPENRFFRIPELQTGSPNHLYQFFSISTLLVIACYTHYLLGKGTTAALHLSALHIAYQGFNYRYRIYPPVAIKMSIFKLQYRHFKPIRHAIYFRKAPLPISSYLSRQQFPLSTLKHGSIRLRKKMARQTKGISEQQ